MFPNVHITAEARCGRPPLQTRRNDNSTSMMHSPLMIVVHLKSAPSSASHGVGSGKRRAEQHARVPSKY